MPLSPIPHHAFRALRKDIPFALLVIFTLALGIGSTTAVFSVVYTVLGQPLPYPDSNRLVELYESKNPNDEFGLDSVSPANFLDWQRQTSSLASIGACSGFIYNLTGRGLPERIYGAAISSSYFDVLGVQPEIGRTFSADEDRSGTAHVVVLSHEFWESHFQSDPAIVGRAIALNGDPFTVVGVMPLRWQPDREQGFELWVPLQQQVRPDRLLWRNIRYLTVIARLKPGVSLNAARADLNRVSSSLKRENSNNDVYGGAVVMSLRHALGRKQASGLYLCLGIVIMVLLIGGANVMNLMLVRVDRRARELAIRMALGASRAQIFGQLLIESLILAFAAGACGIALAHAGQRILTALLPAHASTFETVTLNLPVLGFALLLSLLSGIVFGLAPAFAASRPDVQTVLRRATTRSSGDRTARRWRNSIVIGEIGLAVALLVATGLLFRSLGAVQKVPLGFDPENLISARIMLPRIKYQDDRDETRFAQRVEQQLRLIPGVEDVAAVEHLPLTNSAFTTSFSFRNDLSSSENFPVVKIRLINPSFFSVLRVPVLQGRAFTETDGADSQPVAIVNQAMAKKFWPDQDVLGQAISPTRNDADGTHKAHVVVGVVGNVADALDEDPQPTMYVPYAQMPFHSVCFILRTHQSAGTLLAPIQKAVMLVDPDQPVVTASSMRDLVAENYEPWKFSLTLMGCLGSVAITLTLIGIFGVISYLVRERNKEIGIRLAIGASPSQIKSSILGSGLRLAVAGILIGVVIAAACTRYLQSIIFGIDSHDPQTYISVAALVLATVILASYLPARRAASTDPLTALREE